MCPEESTLRLLNNLLIDTRRRMIHYHCAGLIIDLGVDSGIANEVDNPFLTFIGREAKARGEIAEAKVSGK